MSLRQIVWGLALMTVLTNSLTVHLAASEVWTVPVTAEPAVLTAPGFVIADRGGLTPLKGPAERSILAWVAGHGQVVQAGEPVAIYDTTAIARQVAVRRGELALAEANLAASRLESAKAPAELQERRQALTAELAAVRARRAALGSDAHRRQALAQGRQALADLALADRERATTRTQANADAGAMAAEDARRATADIATGRLQILAQQAEDRRAEEDLDPSITATRLASQEANLLLRLGVTSDNQADPTRGLSARLALGADTGSIAWFESERDTRRRQLHDIERDSTDHTPVQWIELTPGAGGPPRRYDLSVLAKDGQGFGWEEPVQIENPAKPVVVVAGQRRWRAQLSPGTWRIAIGLGDEQDWDGALVQVLRPAFPALTLHASNRLAANATVTAVQDVAIQDGLLVLAFGGDDDGPNRRTVRAPVAGTVLLQPETQRGMRVTRGFRTLGFLAGAAAVQIAARIPLGQAPLYTAATGTDPDPLVGIARQNVGILLPNGDQRSATVLAVGAKPVSRRATLGGWDESEETSPQDLIANELTLGISQPLPLRTAVTVRALVIPPTGWTAVPPHLVGRRDRLAWLRSPGGPARKITAWRCGPVELVKGLHPGDRLRDPGAPPNSVDNEATPEAEADTATGTATATATDSEESPGSQPKPPFNGFLGEVIALERDRVVMPHIWGLVQELIPDGTDVHAGDQVLTVHSPWLDTQREQIAQDRKRSETDRALAVRERQLKALDEADRRADQSVAGLEARTALAIATRPRPAKREAALAAVAVARSQGAETRRRLAAWQALAESTASGASLPALASAQEAATRAAAEEARAEVEAAATVEPLLPGAQATAAAQRQEDLLAGRAGDAGVAAAERRAGIARAEARAIGAQDLAAWAEDFARLRVIRAPSAGRLYWATAYNEQTRTMGKVTRDTMVWGGMAVAEIVDLRRLGCSFELPEDRWHSLREGLTVSVTLPSLGGLRLPGTITRIARLIEPPRDSRIIEGVQIADRRVFRVIVRLDTDSTAAPAASAVALQPGVKTILTLPESP